jgi:hypothetical protein
MCEQQKPEGFDTSLGIAILCPVFSNSTNCSQLDPKYAKFSVILSPDNNDQTLRTLSTIVHFDRLVWRDKYLMSSNTKYDSREAISEKALHAVCTAQVFRNPHSGHYLYLFSSHYLLLGYLVIVYDRYKCCVLCGRWM